jgi:hypothetical protein
MMMKTRRLSMMTGMTGWMRSLRSWLSQMAAEAEDAAVGLGVAAGAGSQPGAVVTEEDGAAEAVTGAGEGPS